MNVSPWSPKTLRGRLYATADRLRGAPERRILRELHQAARSPKFADATSAAYLRRILDHAVSTTTHYKHIPEGAPLDAFPIITKNTIREHHPDLLSNAFTQRDLTSASTSGSTGTPLIVVQDKTKRLRRRAEAVHFGHEAGFALGTRLYNLKIWSGRNHQSRLMHHLRNTRAIDVLTFTDAEIGHFVEMLHSAQRPAAIIAYASALEELARHLDVFGLDQALDVQSVIAQSEKLSPDARTRLEMHLNAPVVARYGSEEVGIIGQQEPTSADYALNRTGVHVEILDLERDDPATPGDLGRITVTDLHNYAMPIIRYDIGDLGRFSINHLGQVDRSRLAEVEGRTLDQLFDSRGQRISSFVFYKHMWKYAGIRQFQIVQHGDVAYTIRLNVSKAFDAEPALLADFHESLGKGASIAVEYVDEIPVLQSGKRRQVVNEAHST